MLKFLQLFAISLLLMSCKTINSDQIKKPSQSPDKNTSKHVTGHISHVTSSIAASQSTVTNLAKQMFP
jgi:hypothetical protein